MSDRALPFLEQNPDRKPEAVDADGNTPMQAAVANMFKDKPVPASEPKSNRSTGIKLITQATGAPFGDRS